MQQQQYYPVYYAPTEKNKPAQVSFVLAIISIVLLVLIIPSLFIGGILLSMAGQSPEASDTDPYDRESMGVYDRESNTLMVFGLIFFFTPPILSGITGIIGLVFGILGVNKPGKRGQAKAGIVMSGITVFIGIIVLFVVL